MLSTASFLRNPIRRPAYLRGVLIILCLVSSGLCYAQANGGVITSTLDELNKRLAAKQMYDREKEKTIAAVRKELESVSSTEEAYEIFSRLYGLYATYNYDLAHDCTRRMQELAIRMGDRGKEMDAILLTVYTDVSAGFFLEANERKNTVNVAELNADQLIFYYSTCAKLYLDMAGSIHTEPYQSQYSERSIQYSERVIALIGPDNPDALPHLTNIYRCQKRYANAIESLKLFLARKEGSLTQRSLTVSAGGLGEFYLMLGDTTAAISYLTYSAIHDIEAATKETPALSLLAGILYAHGDIDRAYAYANAAYEDANFYQAQHRKIEVGNVLPIIDATRYDIIERQNRSLFIYSILVSALIVLVLASMIIIWRQVWQLNKARKVIEEKNSQLQESNRNLTFANKIKEEYIGYFFRLNYEYLNEQEKFQKAVAKRIANRQYDELEQILKRMDFRKEREDRLQFFDNMALKIFPDFLDQFNQLFEEKDRYAMSARNSLPPEVRIFILIRLGISDSEDIARLLDYSVNTINAYKTKVKNRAIAPNDMVKKKVMEIEPRYNRND